MKRASGGESGPGAGGEVLQPGAERQHHVGLGRQRVGRGRAEHADRARVAGVVVEQDACARRWSRRRDAGAAPRTPASAASARDSARRRRRSAAAAWRARRRCRRLGDRVTVGPRRAALRARAARRTEPDSRTPRPARPGRADERRPAVGRVEQHARPPAAATDQLLGPGDPVPVAGHRPEGVVDADRRVAEVLDLLQHRVGQPAGEDVAGEQQHRQPVGVRDTPRR